MISGYGKMGRMVEKTLNEMGIECAGRSEDIMSFDPAVARESVCIDFTVPAAIRANYRFLAENFKAVVIGTTGWDDIRDEVIAYFRKCGTTMVYASNFSIGVNIFFAVNDFISKKMAQAGCPERDGEESRIDRGREYGCQDRYPGCPLRGDTGNTYCRVRRDG